MYQYRGYDHEVYTILGWDTCYGTHLIIQRQDGKRSTLDPANSESLLRILGIDRSFKETTDEMQPWPLRFRIIRITKEVMP